MKRCRSEWNLCLMSDWDNLSLGNLSNFQSFSSLLSNVWPRTLAALLTVQVSHVCYLQSMRDVCVLNERWMTRINNNLAEFRMIQWTHSKLIYWYIRINIYENRVILRPRCLLSNSNKSEIITILNLSVKHPIIIHQFSICQLSWDFLNLRDAP